MYSLKHIQKRKGSAEMGGAVKLIILLIIVFIVGAAVLPTALGTWWNATSGNNLMKNADSGSKAIWPIVPLFGLITILLMIVGVALKEFGVIRLAKHRGSAEMGGAVKLIILLIIVFIVGAAVLPTALGTWWNATSSGHAFTSADTGSKAIWPIVPLFGLIAILLMIVGVALKQFGVFKRLR